MNRSAMLPTSEFTFPGSLGLDDFLKMQSGDDVADSQALLASLLSTPPSELGDETKRKISPDFDDIALQNPSKVNHGDAVDNVEHDQDDLDGDQDHPQKKKPGRKPLTTAPNSKRKAQNRAAQRAFRERKERYVKDLEEKVSQLENQSSNVTKENQLLRAMIDKLKSENSLLKSSNFTFDFPISAANDNTTSNRIVQPIKASSVYTPPSSDSSEDPSSGASSANSPSANVPIGSSIESPLSSFGASPRSTSDSIAASDEQAPSTCSAQDLLSDPVFDASGALGKTSSSGCKTAQIGSVNSPPAPLQFQGQLFSNYRDTSSGVFDDGFDLQPLPMTSLFGDQTADVGDLLMSPNGGNNNLQMPNVTSSPSIDSKRNALSQESVAQLVSCPKLWEKISTHPNFDDLDIDNLCSELKKKAKCSGHGPVVKEEDVNAVLRNAGITF